MIRFTPRALRALVLILGLVVSAAAAHAAATVKRFSIEIGGGATQVAATNYNKQNEFLNRNYIEPRGLDGLKRLTYSFLYDVGARYFVRPNVALRAGIGQMRSQTEREYLPAIRQAIRIRSEVLSVPAHLGADYYFAPYNQGDFQARAFVGGGILNTLTNRVLFQSYEEGTDAATTLFGTDVTKLERDAPGWYSEFGVHMFFALRYSVVIDGYYRSAKARGLAYTGTGDIARNPSDGQPFELDLSGIGARGALCIGF